MVWLPDWLPGRGPGVGAVTHPVTPSTRVRPTAGAAYYAAPAAVQLETYPRPRYVETQIFWFTPAPGGGFVLLFARLLMIGNEP